MHASGSLALAFCAVWSLGGPAFAQDSVLPGAGEANCGFGPALTVPQQSSDRPPAAPEIAIGPADTLDVRVFADEIGGALSGRFAVSRNGIVSLPVIGALEVAGLAPVSVQEHIRKRLCDTLFVSSIVAVSIVEFAPVFVLGKVAHRGPVEYEPGMSVFDLLVLAGGIDRGTEDADLPLRLAESRLSRQHLLARRQRLLAEVAGRGKLDMSAFDGDATLRDVVESELHLFADHLRSDGEARNSLQHQSEILRSEMRLLNARMAMNRNEATILREISDRQNVLTEKGMVARAKFDETRLDLLRAEAEGLELRTELVRAEQQLSELDRQIADIRNTRSVASSSELTEVDRELAGKAVEIEAIQAMIDAEPLGLYGRRGKVGADIRIVLYRSADQEFRSRIVADGSLPLERGDVLVVYRDSESPERLSE